MKKTILRQFFILIAIIFFFNSSSNGQNVPGINNNVTLLGHLDSYNTYSNIWGYIDSLGNEYAIIGHNAGTSVVNITNPSSPVEIGMIPGPSSVGIIWREIKTYKKYAYVVSEHTSPSNLSGLQIIDLSYLPDSVRYVKRYLWPGVDETNARAHTVTVDGQGYVFIQGGTATLGGTHQGGIRILSLADPENPVQVSVFDPRYVHDVFIQDTILFAHNIFDFPGHIDIVNISDRANPQLIHSHIYQNGFSHDSWTTEDKNYLVSSDEMEGLTIKIWDISVLWDADPNNNDDITLVGEYISDPAYIAHEPRVKGNYIYISHYVEGVRIVDISDPSDPVEVGYYDTYPQPGSGFNGDWGVWPFFPSGNFVVSDIQTGLYIFKFDSLNAGGIEGSITSLTTSIPISNVQMKFVEADKIIFTDQDGNFSFRTNEGDHTIILSKAGFITDTVNVTLPAGANIIQNFTLEENQANISLSVDSLSVNIPVDSIVNIEFMIGNIGLSGTLKYSLDDIIGPPMKINSLKRNELKNLRNLKILNSDNYTETISEVFHETLVGDTIIVDPADDLVFGTGGDIITVYAATSANNVTIDFEFANDIDTDSTFILFSVDTDFDQNTGAFPGGFGFNLPEQAIGSEYDVLLDVPGLFSFPPQPLRYYIWIGSNTQPTGNPIATGSVSLNGRILTITIPLSQIGDDDGNMTIAGFAGHLDTNITLTSLDYVPDIGHGEIGINPNTDLPWLTLNPESGSIQAGNSDLITATFNSKNLEKNNSYSGYIVVYSNDPDEPVRSIPVLLNTVEPMNTEEENNIPQEFSLGQNYPNPFNPNTIIPFNITQTENVRLKIYNIIGQEIRTLINNTLSPGNYKFSWDGKDSNRMNVTSGVYFYSLEQSNKKITRKMILSR
ncbi:MAG: choice-of-anchor B family protein [Ignavibacteria bacterium]|nr:choice-of-anchor B family protein [Ignavibacteria bacterium]